MKQVYRFCAGLFCMIIFTTGALAEPVDFKLSGIDGNDYRLSDYRGKWVLVNYWATWCPPCLEELPELEAFHNDHKDDDAIVIGVNMERITQAPLKAFVEDQFLSFPIVHIDPAPKTELGQIPGLPTSYLVSPDGEVVARQVGPLTAKMVEGFIQRFEKQRTDDGGGK